MNELLIKFFNRTYIFSSYVNIELLKNIYINHKNCDEFEEDLERNSIEFCYDLGDISP